MRVNRSSRHPVKIWASQLEPQAEQQALNLAALPFIHRHVALMPDAHLGKGSTVGAVLATRGAILLAACGVDIGCGMEAVQLVLGADALGGDKFLARLRDSIEAQVPVGHAGNAKECDAGDAFLRETERSRGFRGWLAPTCSQPISVACKRDQDRDKLKERARLQYGSLGGGNHFIELCLDQNDGVWVVLHSGSRGVGNALATRHIEAARGLMRQYFIDLPDPDLAYLVQDTPAFDAYLKDLLWSQDYARGNRQEMLHRVLECLGSVCGQPMATQRAVSCHHNYTRQENHFGANVWITRKGAVSARDGEWGVIPGSMGTRSYVVQGKGSAESFTSCAHGAGRAMSRKEARRRFTLDDLRAQTQGVECRLDDGVIDEAPGAYKDIDQVMADQVDLVDVRYTLKQVLCVKG